MRIEINISEISILRDYPFPLERISVFSEACIDIRFLIPDFSLTFQVLSKFP